MKANKVPEKIYVTPHFERRWFTKEIDDASVEYTRTDVLIEKAEKYLKDKFIKDVSVLAGGPVHINFSTAIKNFINYMGG